MSKSANRFLIFIISIIGAIVWGICTRHDFAVGGELVLPLLVGIWYVVGDQNDGKDV